jgi:hypothetical protein
MIVKSTEAKRAYERDSALRGIQSSTVLTSEQQRLLAAAVQGPQQEELPGLGEGPETAPAAAPARPSEPVPVKKRRQSYSEQLTRAWAFLRERAPSEAEASALDQEYERQIAEGPRYHRGSEFIDVPRINCDRNFLAKVLFVARAIERGSYKVRSKGKHGGTLGRSALAVLELLINMAQARQGRVAPGYEAMAAIVRMSRQTVITAINVLEVMGLVTVIRRIKRVRTALGFKTVQATNAFDIHPPDLAGKRRSDTPRGRRAPGGMLNLGALAAAMFVGSSSESKNFSAPKGAVFSKQESKKGASKNAPC